MEIIIGNNSGFCAGVRYTVLKAEDLSNQEKTIYCLGELVHNERIIEDLKKKGITFKDNIEEIPDKETVIIRAHGETKGINERASEKNLNIVDLTCGKIRIIRNKIKEKLKDYSIIIIGKKNHPETIGTKSFSGEDSYTIETIEDIKEVLKQVQKNKLYIVAQTTFSSEGFDKIIKEIEKEFTGEILVDKTICDATEKRQEETRELSKEVDKMIIIGGKKSSNTKELYNISLENQPNTYLIQDVEELKKEDFDKDDRVGVMAGASTPQIVVDEVITFLEKISK